MKTNHLTLVHRLVLLFLATVLLAIAGVGCNTAHGFGKDVEKAGDKIQEGTK
jgi:predicted small secreted protein